MIFFDISDGKHTAMTTSKREQQQHWAKISYISNFNSVASAHRKYMDTNNANTTKCANCTTHTHTHMFDHRLRSKFSNYTVLVEGISCDWFLAIYQFYNILQSIVTQQTPLINRHRLWNKKSLLFFFLKIHLLDLFLARRPFFFCKQFKYEHPYSYLLNGIRQTRRHCLIWKHNK